MAVLLLGACAQQLPPAASVSPEFDRLITDTFQDTPFDTGAITVLAEEHGELRSFRLRPCGGNHICGARQGHVADAPAYWVVTGAYSGRTFYISPGGDGWIKRDGALHPMAWN